MGASEGCQGTIRHVGGDRNSLGGWQGVLVLMGQQRCRGHQGYIELVGGVGDIGASGDCQGVGGIRGPVGGIGALEVADGLGA